MVIKNRPSLSKMKIIFEKVELSRLNPILFPKFGLIRLKSFFVPKIQVEPAQPNFCR